MRISDWSSDVCSSDLCDYRTPLPVFRPEFSLNSGPEFSLDRCFAGDRHDQNIAGQRSGTRDDDDIVTRAGCAGDAEIGRAACRERVCTSVYISVVALHLKQKNRTTTPQTKYTT